jgi:hypothetical protein
VSNERLGKKLTCMACDERFTLSPGEARAESSSQPAAEADETWGPKLLQKALGDPSAVLDGVIPGAVSGVVAGVFVALLVGILTGEAVGETVFKVLFGFVTGFVVGTLLGAILGVGGRRIRPDVQIKSGFALLVGGAVIGGLVAVIVEPFRWLPLGAGLGAVGAHLWALLCRRVESAAAPPGRKTWEEDFLSDDDERPNRRHSRQTSSRYSGE